MLPLQTDTTSSSFAGEEKLSAGVALGQFNPLTGELENGVDIKTSFTAKQDLKNSTDTINGAFNSMASDFAGDGPERRGLVHRLLLLPLRLPGHRPEVSARPRSPTARRTRRSRCIMFSAPLPSTAQHLASDTLEWYQPPWEFGNLLSYPAGLAQLKQYMPDIVVAQDQKRLRHRRAPQTTPLEGRAKPDDHRPDQDFLRERHLSIEGKMAQRGSRRLGAGASFDRQWK